MREGLEKLRVATLKIWTNRDVEERRARIRKQATAFTAVGTARVYVCSDEPPRPHRIMVKRANCPRVGYNIDYGVAADYRAA